jgi:proline iminopeptidase
MPHLRSPYPPIAPYRSGRLRVGARHELHFEEYGNPDGKPAVCLHGGPGTGLDPNDARLYDPLAYRIVLFDQRGAGKSTPSASVEENTTWDLVADLEALRTSLGIERWQVFGGSWGCTLALAYAQLHPVRVSELVLRGVFFWREEEIDWFYRSGASHIFPDHWESFLSPIPEAERSNLLGAYHRRLLSDDPAAREEAARAWCNWELTTCSFVPDRHLLAFAANPQHVGFLLSLARLECHYLVHRAWLGDRPILDHIDAIRSIPCRIVQGRYDMVCPLRSAWDLHRAWPEAGFTIIEGAGHAASEPGIASALLDATDRFRPAV